MRQLRALRTRRTVTGARRWLVGAAALAALGVGAMVGPSTIAPTQSGAVTHWGGWPLETAFQLAVMAAAVLTFRVVEVLFRTDDAQALDMLPIPGAAYAVDRVAVLLRDAALAAVFGAALLAPSVMRPGGELAAIAILYLAASGLVTVGAGFGVVTLAATSAHEGATGNRSGAVYHFAPGVAFGVAAALLLFLKLGFEQPFADAARNVGAGPGLSRAAQVALGVPLVGSLLLCAAGARAYSRMHHALQARFREADSVASGRFAERAQAFAADEGDPTRLWASATRAQLLRRHPLLLPSSWIAGAIGVMVAWGAGGELPAGLMAGVATLWLVWVVHPLRRWHRLPDAAPFALASTLPGHRARLAGGQSASGKALGEHLIPMLLPAIATGTISAALGYVAVLLAATAAYIALRSQPPTRAASGACAAALFVSLATAWILP
jgi:hypothetical protein